jgi:hypothetical protein
MIKEQTGAYSHWSSHIATLTRISCLWNFWKEFLKSKKRRKGA